MIELTKYDPKYQDALKKMMLTEDLDYKQIALCLETTYVVVDREEVLGFGYFNGYGDKIYLDHLYIKTSERLNFFGDSLFRTILNALQLMGVNRVYMRKDAVYDLFLSKENIAFDGQEYVIDLHEFFNRKCRGEKNIDTPLH